MVASSKCQSPPLFDDLEKNARRIFGREHQFEVLNGGGASGSSGSASGDKDSLSALLHLDTDRLLGSLTTRQTTRVDAEYAFTTIKTYDTNHGVTASLSLQNRVTNGMKLAVDIRSSLAGCWVSTIKGEYRNDVCALNCEAGSGNTKLAAVVGHRGWLAGCQLGFDAKELAVTSSRLALGFAVKDYTINTHIFQCGDHQGMGGSAYLRLRPGLEAGAHAQWAIKSAECSLGLGCAWDLRTAASLRASLSSTGHVGVGYERGIGGGKLVTVSAVVDAGHLYHGHHTLAVGLEVRE